MATSTVEDYLKCILLEQQARPDDLVTTGRIAEALGVAPGTATAMVKTLADSDLLIYEPYSGVRLTRAGRQLAAHVVRRHRLLELFLVQVMGMDWSEVHEEAERLEHAVSDRVLERMDEMLGNPSVDPHGDPIPDSRGLLAEQELASLLACPLAVPMEVARVRDQSPEFLQLVQRRGLKPASRLSVRARSEATDTVELEVEGEQPLSLGFRAASKILVRPIEGHPPVALADPGPPAEGVEAETQLAEER
jgi:DtxR family Mn-dependent transcriptional regulator